MCAIVAAGVDPGMQMALVCVCTERLQTSRLSSDHDKTCTHTRSQTHAHIQDHSLFQGPGQNGLLSLSLEMR